MRSLFPFTPTIKKILSRKSRISCTMHTFYAEMFGGFKDFAYFCVKEWLPLDEVTSLAFDHSLMLQLALDALRRQSKV